MSYYTDVYLRKLNRFGNNLQERIINKKEYDFNNFIKRSPNKVTVFNQDKKFEGVLQSKTYNEIETIDYFLTFKSIQIPTGTILKILDIKNPKVATYWIVICKDNFVSAGYDRYTVVKLDREIRWITKDGYLFKALAHISGSGANARDKRITSSYKIQDKSLVFLPNQNLTVTLKDNPLIQRGVRVNIKDSIWKISGIENISNDGVCYLTLEQDYIDELNDTTTHLENEPTNLEGIADGYKLEQWDFSSSLDNEKFEEFEGKEYPVLEIIKDVETPIDFKSFYYSIENNSELFVQTSSAVQYKERTLIGTELGSSLLTVGLKESPDIKKTYIVKVVEQITNKFYLEAPSRFKMGKTQRIYSNKPFDVVNIVPVEDKENVAIGSLVQEDEKYYRTICSNKIINNLLVSFESLDETSENITKAFSIESIWLGGI